MCDNDHHDHRETGAMYTLMPLPAERRCPQFLNMVPGSPQQLSKHLAVDKEMMAKVRAKSNFETYNSRYSVHSVFVKKVLNLLRLISSESGYTPSSFVTTHNAAQGGGHLQQSPQQVYISTITEYNL